MKIERLNPSDESAVVQFLGIYGSSIELSEQKSAAQVRSLVVDPRYHILVSRDAYDVTGFAMIFVPSRALFVLLEYMAVDSSLRGHGVGAALLDAAKRVATEHDAPLLLEVDQAGAAVSAGNDPARRLRFYGERGCQRIVGLDYILPLEANGTPPPMWLLVSGQSEPLTRDELHEWLKVLYVEVYGQDDCDPRIGVMLAMSACQHFPLSSLG